MGRAWGSSRLKRKACDDNTDGQGDRYREDWGWPDLSTVNMHRIASELDIISAGRLARCIPGYRVTMRNMDEQPFGTPGLLYPDNSKWPDDRDGHVSSSI